MLLRPEWLRDRFRNPPGATDSIKKQLYIIRRIPELVRSYAHVRGLRGDYTTVEQMEEAWPRLLEIAIHSEWRW